MNTLSLNRTANATFKRTQLLPLLNSVPKPARRETPSKAASTTSRQLPRGQVTESFAERVLFGLLTASAAFSVCYAFAMILDLLPNWPKLSTWVAQLFH